MLIRRSKLINGLDLKVAWVKFNPMLYVNSTTGEPYGFNIELWKSISLALNVTTDFIKAPSFGKMGEGGQWSGSVGMAQKGEVDVVLSPMSTTYERYSIIYLTIAKKIHQFYNI